MKRALALLGVVFILSGCGNNSNKESDTNIIFKEEIATVSKIGDATGKKLANVLTVEDIESMFNEIFKSEVFESKTIEYGEVIQGAGSDGNGGKIFCCKLPVNVNFIGKKESVEEFVEYFKKNDKVVSFGDFKVDKISDDKYEVNTIINFLGKTTDSVLGNNGGIEYTITKNVIEEKEIKEIVLRDFDISMTIRPSNSDSAAVCLGVVSDKDYRICDDDNSEKDIKVTFNNEGNKYYCEYSRDDFTSERVFISPKGNILFDILSCDLVENDDYIKANVYIINNSNKKVSCAIYNDEDERVKIVEKVGSVEVKK